MSAEASLPCFGNKAVVEEESQWKVLYFTLAAKSIHRKFITNGTEDIGFFKKRFQIRL